jgi:hypothetical protein
MNSTALIRELLSITVPASVTSFIVVTVSLFMPQGQLPAEACCTAANDQWIGQDEDTWRNYDYRSHEDTFLNVDWAFSILFFNNATINSVKSALGGSGGSKQYAVMNDGPYFVWDEDGGKKRGNYCWSWGQHTRLYAPNPPDFMYNMSWHYYVLATAHYDGLECTPVAEFGWSEDAEDYFVNFMWNNGYNAAHDWESWENYQCCYWEGVWYWQNNGMASWVLMPW